MVSLRTVAPGACAFVAAATTSHSSSSPTTSLHSSIDNNDPAPSADNSGNSPHTNTGMQHFTTHGSKAEATSSGKRTSSEHRASSTKLSSSCAHYPTSRADSPSMPWPPIKDVCNQRNVSLSEFTKAEADYSSVCHQEPTTDVWNKDDLGTLCEYLAVTGHTSDNSPPPIANAWIEFNPRFAKISCNYTGCDDGLLSDPASCGHSDDYPYYRPPLANMCLFSLSRFVGWMNDLQRELQEQYNFIGNAIPSLPDEFGMNGADGIGGDPGGEPNETAEGQAALIILGGLVGAIAGLPGINVVSRVGVAVGGILVGILAAVNGAALPAEPKYDEFEAVSDYTFKIANATAVAITDYIDQSFFEPPKIPSGTSAYDWATSDDAPFQILAEGLFYPRYMDHLDISTIDKGTLQASVVSVPLDLIYHQSKITAVKVPKGSIDGFDPCGDDPKPWSNDMSGCDKDGTYWGLTRWQLNTDLPGGGPVIAPEFVPDLKNANKLGQWGLSAIDIARASDAAGKRPDPQSSSAVQSWLQDRGASITDLDPVDTLSFNLEVCDLSAATDVGDCKSWDWLKKQHNFQENDATHFFNSHVFCRCSRQDKSDFKYASGTNYCTLCDWMKYVDEVIHV